MRPSLAMRTLYCFDDYKRTIHHGIMKRTVQASLKSHETVDAIFSNIG